MNGLPDFEAAARLFQARGWSATCLAPALWRFQPAPNAPPAPLQLILSVGVHGDETTPITLLAKHLPAWAQAAGPGMAELLVVVGNLEAVAAARRFIRHDMNRMFDAVNLASDWGTEGERAQQLTSTLARHLRRDGPCVHLDLHTTIRPSHYPTFAVLPSASNPSPLLHWLQKAHLHAAVFNPTSSGTFSAWSTAQGAQACTLELGDIRGLTSSVRLEAFESALDALVRSPTQAWNVQAPSAAQAMRLFEVAQAVQRSSPQFEFFLPADTPNFAPLALGQVVAHDGEHVVSITQPGQCIIFPNPNVAVGLRAGLLLNPL